MAEEPNLQKIVQETQRFRQSKSDIDMVWWIPNEYWEVSLKTDARMTPEAQKEFIGVIDKYLVFAVLEGRIGLGGSLTGTSKEELEGKITVLVQGKKLTPLPETELSDDARNFFQMMRPLLGKMLGQFGQGMHFVVFQGKNAKGERHADPNEQGFLTLNLAEKEFKWRLPLGCFLPSKYDPKTGEDFPGNYEYSPFTGTKLVTVKSAGTAGGGAK
jgi:hypothetical protein